MDGNAAANTAEAPEATVLAPLGGAVTDGGAEEASRVARRLERIEALDRERAPAGRLLHELRELVHEAEAWARVEVGTREPNAAEKVREGAEGMH